MLRSIIDYPLAESNEHPHRRTKSVPIALFGAGAGFPASERTARGYMQLAANRQRVADLEPTSVREALAELAEPRAVEPVPEDALAVRQQQQRSEHDAYMSAVDASPNDAEVVAQELG